jgi:organic hydroperoxide reductase OsmC/OhrA
MSEHRIKLKWLRDEKTFSRESYSRDHQITLQDQALNASSAIEYGGSEHHSDPEQMLAAAVSSCHMLTFLAVLANRGIVLDQYQDEAVAVLGKNAEGQSAVVQVKLNPKVSFAPGHQQAPDALEKFHQRAHRACFIANSIRAEVLVNLS